MTIYQLPDMPAKIPAIPDKKLTELLEKYATKLEEVLDNLTGHPISSLAAQNTDWSRAFVLLLQFGIWDTCNVARSIQLLAPHNLGRQTLSLARDSLEMIVNLFWIHGDIQPRMTEFLEYSFHYNERYRRALEEAGGHVWAWAQKEQGQWLSQVTSAWTAYQKQNPNAKLRSSWSKTNTSARGTASKMMERHEYIYFSQATHISPIMAYHKGSCDIVPQAPLFVKPGTFDEFSTGNRILPAG